MLDGQRYYSEFPDEEPEQPRQLPLRDELLGRLAAIEKEISTFMGAGTHQDENIAEGSNR